VPPVGPEGDKPEDLKAKVAGLVCAGMGFTPKA